MPRTTALGRHTRLPLAGAIPSMERLKKLPGNKRGPGAFDVFRDPDGRLWASWNYLSRDYTGATALPRRSRFGALHRAGSGTHVGFRVTWSR